MVVAGHSSTGGGAEAMFDEARKRRQALMGASGARALFKNGRVASIAAFATIGGLLYGYNQGVFSGLLAMPAFGKRRSISTTAMHKITKNRHQRLYRQPHPERLVDFDSGARCLGWHASIWLRRGSLLAQVWHSHCQQCLHPRCRYSSVLYGRWS